MKKPQKCESVALLLAFVVMIMIAACGGGGGNDVFDPPYCFLDIFETDSITLRVGETNGPWYPSLYCGGPDDIQHPPVTFNWSSSNNNIVTAVDGLITGISEGSARITASTSYQGESFSESVTIVVIAGCNKLPNVGQPPQISSDPDVAAIQNFNRLLIASDLTAEKLVPYVSESYNYAGEDYSGFKSRGLPDIIKQLEPDGNIHCYAIFRYFDPCSIGIEKEEITINNNVAQNEIIVIKTGLWQEVNIITPAHPSLSAIYRIAKRFDFIKENDGKWRFIAARTISGEYGHIFGGDPPLAIEASITPFDTVSLNDEIKVAGQISGADKIAAILQPVSGCYGTPFNTGNVFDETFKIEYKGVPNSSPADCLPIGVDHLRLNIGGIIEVNNQTEWKYSSFILKNYFIAVHDAPICEDNDIPPEDPEPPPAETDNLCIVAGVVAQASSSFAGYPPERAIDGNLNTSWFTAIGDAANLGMAPYFEIIFPQNAIVRKISMFGNRQFATGYDFYSGKFEVFDPNDILLYDSGIVDLPAPDRDISLDLPNIDGVRRVRFTAVDDESQEPGFSELEVIGEFQ